MGTKKKKRNGDFKEKKQVSAQMRESPGGGRGKLSGVIQVKKKKKRTLRSEKKPALKEGWKGGERFISWEADSLPREKKKGEFSEEQEEEEQSRRLREKKRGGFHSSRGKRIHQ